MSVEAISFALSQSDTENPSETLVLVCFANYAGHNGKAAWPSLNTVADYCRLSERQVRRVVRDLEAKGVLVRGDQQHVAHYRSDRRPIVYNIPMGPDAPRRGGTSERGDNLTPREMTSQSGLRGDMDGTHGGTPVSAKPKTKPLVLKRDTQPEADVCEEREEPVRVQPSDRVRRARPARRLVAESDDPTPGESRLIGSSATSHRARVKKEQQEAIRNPKSAIGLAQEFARRVREEGLDGPQELDQGALARNIRRWMDQGDTPEKVQSMFDKFFANPGTTENGYVVWRRFVFEGPKLRAGVNTSTGHGIDYAATEQQHQEQLKLDAARGDIRAQNALDGKNRPWLTYTPTKTKEEITQ